MATTKRPTHPRRRSRPAGSRPPIPPIPEGAVWLRPDQAGAILQLTANHIYRLLRSKAVPSIKLGKQYRVPRQALMDLANKLEV